MAPEWVRPTLFFGAWDLSQTSNAAESVRKIAQRVVADRGLELVDVQVSGARDGGAVRVFVERPGGIGVADLQSLSEEVSALLDVEDPIKGRYRLEVSSPGLDRPLRSAADFRRVLGQSVHVLTVEPVAGRSDWTGRLVSVAEDGTLGLELSGTPGATLLQVALSLVASARQEIVIPPTPRHAKQRKRKKVRKAHG